MHALLIGGALDSARVIVPDDLRVYRAEVKPKVAIINMTPPEIHEYVLHPVYAAFTEYLDDQGTPTVIPLALGCPVGMPPTDGFRRLIEVYCKHVTEEKRREQH